MLTTDPPREVRAVAKGSACAGGAMHMATTPAATRPAMKPHLKPRRSAVESKPIMAPPDTQLVARQVGQRLPRPAQVVAHRLRPALIGL